MPVIVCPNCGGDGWVTGKGGFHVNCPRCDGHGRIYVRKI